MESVIQEALVKGVEMHKSGQLDLAKQLYASVIAVEPRHADANHNTGKIEIEAGNISQAIPLLRIALEENPDYGQYWISYIDALICMGASDDARIMLTQAKQRGAKGEPFDQLEKSIKETLEPAQGKFPSQTTSISTQSSMQDPPQEEIDHLTNLFHQGKVEQTLDKAQGLLKQFPNAFILHKICGITHASLNHNDAAIESYKKAINIQPESAQVHFNMAVVLQDTGALEAAISSYAQATKIHSEYVDAYINMGAAQIEYGDTDAALENFNKAIKIQPDRTEIHNNMAKILLQKGHLEAAIATYKKALQVNPNYSIARMGLSSAKSRAVPGWHLPMMNDTTRNDAYFDALKLAISKNDFVLEIGTGSGLLSMMAIEAGAGKVITCEISKSIASAASKIIQKNGFSEKIKVIGKKSTDLIVGTDIPKKADVVLSEILSAEFVGEGVRHTITDANRRLIHENGRMIPESGDIRISLIGNNPEILGKTSVGSVSGFDLSDFNSVTGNKFSLHLSQKPKFLSDTEIAFQISLYEQHKVLNEEKVLTLTALESGLCIGLIQWMGIQVFRDIKYENKPGDSSHWPTPVYLFDKPVEVVTGQELKIQANLYEDAVWFSLLE